MFPAMSTRSEDVVPHALSTGATRASVDRDWAAVCARDSTRDGTLLYGVVTTGVFCKPSCASRRPLRRNVLFFATAATAQGAGFRACLRCRPAEPGAGAADAAIQEACRWMQLHPTETASYAALAARAGMGAAHFHRTFKRLIGVTPKRYADGLRLQHFKQQLGQGSGVTASVYASGFGSSSRVYERSTQALGMTPGQYRTGGKGLALSYVFADTAMGRMLLAATDRGICFLQFGETDEALLQLLRAEFCNAAMSGSTPPHPDLEPWMDGVREYLNGAPLPQNLPLDLRATAFQLRVWDYLQTIPAGQSRSYAQAAAELGSPGATRAVASACARNRVALLVPCHRVLRANGDMGGYRWGVDRKKALLALEQRHPLPEPLKRG